MKLGSDYRNTIGRMHYAKMERFITLICPYFVEHFAGYKGIYRMSSLISCFCITSKVNELLMTLYIVLHSITVHAMDCIKDKRRVSNLTLE